LSSSNRSRKVGLSEYSDAARRETWKNTILAGLANYIDAGSIVAGATALELWAERYHLTPGFLGLLGAFSANGISAGVGALLGGWLCDRFGRKKIYQYDMLFYAFGMAWLVFAFQPWMIVVGIVLVGIAVGADIPASWSLIAEMAPDDRRARHSATAQILWGLGPTVVVLISMVVAPLGILGARIVFAHLLILALTMTLLRSKMQESQRWVAARRMDEKMGESGAWIEARRLRMLLEPRYLKAMAFLIGIYGIWNLWSGTFGFFMTYILRTVAGQSQVAALGLQLVGVPLWFLSLIFIFMRYSDRVNQRLMFGFSACMQTLAMALLAIFPLTVPLFLTFLVLASFEYSQAFYQLWSGELFPTCIRSTAQGITFAIVRIGLGIWSLFVPALVATRFSSLAWILTGFLATSAVIGLIWAPRNEGKSLEQIEAERDQRGTVNSFGL
jgi:inositol transporter-like SP family MFS transporter